VPIQKLEIFEFTGFQKTAPTWLVDATGIEPCIFDKCQHKNIFALAIFKMVDVASF